MIKDPPTESDPYGLDAPQANLNEARPRGYEVMRENSKRSTEEEELRSLSTTPRMSHEDYGTAEFFSLTNVWLMVITSVIMYHSVRLHNMSSERQMLLSVARCNCL